MKNIRHSSPPTSPIAPAQESLRPDITDGQQVAPSGAVTGAVNAREATIDPALTGAPSVEVAAAPAMPGKTQHQESALLRLRLQTAGSGDVPDGLGAYDSAAVRLYEATTGSRANAKEVFRVLSERTSAEIEGISEAFQSRYGVALGDRLGSRLQDNALQKAQLLLRGDEVTPSARDATLLALAIEGVGTDEKEILDVLYARSDGERDAIRSDYTAQTGRRLEDDLALELSGATRVYGLAMLARGTLAPADHLRAAMVGIGTHEEAIFDALKGLSADERAATKTQYQAWYGRDLAHDLAAELGSRDQLRAELLLARGELDGADRLHLAMVFTGTDEDAIREVFAGTSEAKRATIIADYNERYGDLDEALQQELSGPILAEVTSLMEHGELSIAEQLNRAMRGFGADEEAIVSLLDGLAPESLQETKITYQQKYGESLESRLRSELRGANEAKALVLAERGGLDLAETLHFAASGIGADDEEIFAALAEASPEERAGLSAAFEEKYGRSVEAFFASELSGRALKRATLLHEQGSLSLPQALELAMDGVGTREGELFDAIAEASPEAREAALSDPAMMARLASELGSVDLERAQLLLQQGSLTRPQALHFAMAGRGTDEELLLDTLDDLGPGEAAQLQAEYEAAYGRPLLDELKAELGKRDLWKAIDALADPPKTLRERVDRVESKVARERHSGSAIGNFSDALMDLLSHKGFSLDQELREYKAIAREAATDDPAPEAIDGQLSAKEKDLNKLRKAYRKEKVELADKAGSIATYSVAYGAMAVTGGMAALPAAALIAGASGTTRVATRHLIIGDSYDLAGEDGVKDMILGAGEGLSSYAMGQAKDAVTAAIGKRVLAAQGKDVSARGLLQLGRAALRKSSGEITEDMVKKASEKVLAKAGKEFLKRSLLHELAGEALLGATKKGVEYGTLGLSEALADEELYDMEFSDAVKALVTSSVEESLKGMKKGAVAGASIVIGERISDAIHDRIHLEVGRRVAGDEVFSDAELLKSGKKVLGEQASDASEDLLKAVGRERLLRKLGEDALDDTAAEKAMSILLEPLLVRGVSSAIRIPVKGLEKHELWADGMPAALEALWQETLEHASGNVGKVVGEELVLELSRYTDILVEEGFLETFLATAVHETAASGGD